MSLLGSIVRWGSMGLGAVVVAWSLRSSLAVHPLEERARVVTQGEALALAGAREDAFISIDATLDGTTRVFDSSVNRPGLTTTDTNRVYRVDVADGLPPAELVGATVNVAHGLESQRIDCRVVVDDGSHSQRVRSYRILAALEGTDAGVWVLSPSFLTEGEGRAWQARGSYAGALSRFEDLRANAPDLAHDAAQFRAFARSDLNRDIPPDATVILDATGRTPGSEAVRSYLGVEGTDATLIVAIDSIDPPTGTIRGMVEGSHGAAGSPTRQRQIASMMGAADPSRAVVIDTTRSPASAHAGEVAAIRAGLVGGSVLLGLGIAATLLRRSGQGRASAAGREAGAPVGTGRRGVASRAGISIEQANALGIPTGGAPAPHHLAGAQGTELWRRARGGASSDEASGEDAALEAEMARWTSGGANPGSERAA